jgi:hypothetical protein
VSQYLAIRWPEKQGFQVLPSPACRPVALTAPRNCHSGRISVFDILEGRHLTGMVDGLGTTAYAYTSGGQLWTENGPWASDTVTNVYSNRLRIGLALQQPTGLWTNGFA